MILEIFRRTLRTHGLLAPGDAVLVAVSGGGDSVALLRLLADQARDGDPRLVVGHVNHGLRGEASEADQRFVEDLSRRLGLECLSLRAPVPPPRAGDRPPAEETLRRSRRLLLEEAADRSGCHRIALAHTMDDQAETILMRLARGSGRRGLSGMRFAGPGRMIRPLLDVRRAMIRDWLAGIGQPFREDSSNSDPRYLRNRVRERLLPVLEEMNPRVVEALARAGGILALEDGYLDGLARHWLRGRAGRVSGVDLAALPPALGRRVARLMLERAGGDPRGARLADINGLLGLAGAGRDGDRHRLAGGIEASLEGPFLRLTGTGETQAGPAAEPYAIELDVPGHVDLPLGDGVIEARLLPRAELAADPAREAPAGGRVALLDAARLGPRVTVRSRRPGDRFHPLGSSGSRRLKEFLIDRKVPRRRRDRLPLVVGGEGIAWVVGQRVGHPYRLTGTTTVVARLEYTPRVDLTESKRII